MVTQQRGDEVMVTAVDEDGSRIKSGMTTHLKTVILAPSQDPF
jgi:hypothetical protein